MSATCIVLTMYLRDTVLYTVAWLRIQGSSHLSSRSTTSLMLLALNHFLMPSKSPITARRDSTTASIMSVFSVAAISSKFETTYGTKSLLPSIFIAIAGLARRWICVACSCSSSTRNTISFFIAVLIRFLIF